ncbi:MAG: DUF3467 domain-containing protein [Acidobacteriaceae bacterium]|nr:DUF3467 domain-containing protein [Acidobacteriaceae bacterium]MBV9764986.1 DUF3467 domain-containing protein [Acidobacteriaceae bacterium]
MDPSPVEDRVFDVKDARYANAFEIGYTEDEFVLDFAQSYLSSARWQPHTRIVTGPRYAKVLRDLLCKSIDEYEVRFGSTSTEE